MTRRDLYEHFLKQTPWVDPAKTADAIEVGDPEAPVQRVGTGWSACLANLRAAAADGCDLFITHEPAFCEFWEPALRFRDTAWGRERTRILEEHNMGLMALHDSWDNRPEWGIRDSWIRFLGLERCELVARRDYRAAKGSLSLFAVPATTVDGFARHVAARVKPLGMGGVVVMGDGRHPVRQVAIGLGCHIPEFQMLDLGADVLVQVFDRAFQTFTRLPLVDMGAHLIVLEHGMTEMPGMESMARYLKEMFPGLETAFYRREPESRVVTAE